MITCLKKLGKSVRNAGLYAGLFVTSFLFPAISWGATVLLDTPGTYSRDVDGASGDCIEITGNDITLSQSHIGNCGRYGIYIHDAENITINTSTLHDITTEKTAAIWVYRVTNLTIRQNTFKTVASGVHIHGSATNRSSGIVTRSNRFYDMRDWNAIQYTFVHTPSAEQSSILCNTVENIPGTSKVEDNLSFYETDGSPQLPALMRWNKVKNGGPAMRGTGIILGDSNGNYLAAHDNFIISAGGHGIHLAGNHVSAIGNYVYSDQVPWSWHGIGAYGWNGRPCSDITLADNHVNWTDAWGSNNAKTTWYAGGPADANCGVINNIPRAGDPLANAALWTKPQTSCPVGDAGNRGAFGPYTTLANKTSSMGPLYIVGLETLRFSVTEVSPAQKLWLQINDSSSGAVLASGYQSVSWQAAAGNGARKVSLSTFSTTAGSTYTRTIERW